MARGAIVIRESVKRESAHITRCVRCGDSFVMVGSVPIRMGQYRQTKRGKNGSERMGTCPIHRQIVSSSLPSHMFP